MKNEFKIYLFSLLLLFGMFNFAQNSSASSSPELLHNNGFENGRADWIEFPTNSFIINNPTAAASGSWYADLVPSAVIDSNQFILPLNATKLNLTYQGKFTKTGSCGVGVNNLFAVIYDQTADEDIETIILHDANVQTSDSNYVSHSKTSTANLSSRIGHTLIISLQGINNEFDTDPDNATCAFDLQLDNVSLTTSIDNVRPIYRFWSDQKQGHFFTISADEKQSIIQNDKSWKYESVAYNSFVSPSANATPIYRFWSDKKQHHFYTASADEKANIIANDHSWNFEGISYYAYADEQPNTTPVYRFWSDKKQGHFFTIDLNEKNSIEANDKSWKYEGIAWYVPMN